MAAKITHIYRYPVKGFSPQSLPIADVQTGATLAFDRAYAIENGPIGFDPTAPNYFPKFRFLMLMRNERIARLKTHFDPATTLWQIIENDTLLIEGRLDAVDDRRRIEAWISDYFAAELAGPPKILVGGGHSFSDVAMKVLHLVNLASVRDLERHVGTRIDPWRFRANVYIDGLPPWQEFEWLGREIASDSVRFKAVKRTVRCAATNVDPATGARDLEIPKDLMRLYGHADCGIYLSVIDGGQLRKGSEIAVTQGELKLQ